MDHPEDLLLPDLVPVFPLPGTVLFPHTVLPLHVFEPRYREMVRDAAAGSRLIAISLLQPGWEKDYHGRPAFHSIGTVGRIDHLHRLEDGRYDLRLQGLQRVAVDVEHTDQSYQVARVRPLPEAEVDESDPAIDTAKLDLLACHGYLMRELNECCGEHIVLDDRMDFAVAVNMACNCLPIDARLRQALLEEDTLLGRHERGATLVHEVLATVLRLKAQQQAPDPYPLN